MTKKKATKKKESWQGKIITNSEYLKKGSIPRIGDKVAIVGCAETTKDKVRNLYKREGWEIWGINTLWKSTPHVIPKATRWFMTHKYDRVINEKGDFEQWEWLKRVKAFPIYMLGEHSGDRSKEVKMAIPYPIGEIKQKFGTYFTNSISYEMALAIYEGFKEIHLYGVEMALSGEYGYQRPSVEYFIGLARGMGIKVYLPERCDLLATVVLYGYEDHHRMAEKLRQQKMEFNNRTASLNQAREKMAADRNACIGALQMIDNWKLDKEKLTTPTVQELEQQIKQLQQQETTIMQQVLVLKGGNEMVDYVERCWLQEPKTGGQ